MQGEGGLSKATGDTGKTDLRTRAPLPAPAFAAGAVLGRKEAFPVSPSNLAIKLILKILHTVFNNVFKRSNILH